MTNRYYIRTESKTGQKTIMWVRCVPNDRLPGWIDSEIGAFIFEEFSEARKTLNRIIASDLVNGNIQDWKTEIIAK